jgi:hypothetical protein
MIVGQRTIGALALVVAVSTSGCFLAAAGVVEASRGDSGPDPMGTEYHGPNGWLGWHHRYRHPAEAMENLLAGMAQLRCGVANEPQRLRAQCYNRPPVVALQAGYGVYRLCPPYTEIMMCRSAWEAVNAAAPRPFSDDSE